MANSAEHLSQLYNWPGMVRYIPPVTPVYLLYYVSFFPSRGLPSSSLVHMNDDSLLLRVNAPILWCLIVKM